MNLRERSVQHLAGLYTVVLGVALSSGIYQLIDPMVGFASIDSNYLVLFAAFIATLFPFYHGAMMHLDNVYLSKDSAPVKDLGLLVDFLLLFFHGILFVVLSMLIKQPADFLFCLLLILFLDVVWATLAYFCFSKPNEKTETTWGKINFVSVFVLVLFYMVDNQNLAWGTNRVDYYCYVIFGISLFRTLVDYSACWKAYFPDQKSS